MLKKILASFFLGLFLIGTANAITLIDNNTMGYYNDDIGMSLNLTNPYDGTYLFPVDYVTYGDPTFVPVPFEPDLTAASSALGDWFNQDYLDTTAAWEYGMIPKNWAVNTETAIVYEIDAGPTGLNDVVARFGVDNGIFVWLDGIFLNGWLQPGGAGMYEYTQSLGSLSSGSHFLQILREDHGGGTGYNVLVEGDIAPVPEPSTILLLSSGLLGLGWYGRKRKKA